MRIIVNINEIPSSVSVFLYGAGNGGRYIARLLAGYRKDVRVLGFLDTFKSGELCGLPVLKLDDWLSSGPSCDLVLVTSVFWPEIERSLLQKGVGNYRILAADLINDGLLFSREELGKWETELAGARALFTQERDLELFDLLVKSHTEMEDGIRNYSGYFVSNFSRMGRQYLDRVHGPSVKTLIDGGVCDGSTLPEFLGAMPNIEAIHGFEPFLEVYRGGLYQPVLEQEHRICVHPQVLWDKSTPVSFLNCADGQSAVVEGSREGARVVQAVSVDDFAARPGVGKIDMIKLDVEGSELAVLKGARRVLREQRPQVAVCIYHRKQDLFEIPNYLGEVLEDYVFSLGHYTASFRESVLYAIPREIHAKMGA